MEYTWGINDFIDAKKKLKIILKKERNKEQRNYIKAIIETLNSYIEEEQINAVTTSETDTNIPEVSFNETLAEIEDQLTSSQEYYSLVSLFAKTTDQCQDQIDEIESILSQRLKPDDSYAKITGATITNERALSLTNQFFQNFSTSLYPTFKDAFSEREHSIRFVDKAKENCVGDSTFIDIIKRHFINIIKTDDLSKLYTIIHEYGHIISYMLNPKALYFSTEYCFDEVASIFPELVAQYENIGNYDPAHVAFESYLYLVLYRTKAIYLDAHKAFISLWKDHNRDVDDDYLTQLMELYEYNEEAFIEAIETSIYDEGSYIISYMVALELLHIYKQDKEKALTIFESFLKIPYKESAMNYLKSVLEIGSHLQEETTSLINTLKKELKKSGEFHV